MSGFRHQARIAALQCLCAITARNFKQEADIVSCFDMIKRDFLSVHKEADFYKSLVFGVLEHRKQLDEELQVAAPKWKIAHMAGVDRVVLELGLFEMLHTKTPHPIVLNESIEMAKEFGDDGSARLVNGVLSSFLCTSTEDTEKDGITKVSE